MVWIWIMSLMIITYSKMMKLHILLSDNNPAINGALFLIITIQKKTKGKRKSLSSMIVLLLSKTTSQKWKSIMQRQESER